MTLGEYLRYQKARAIAAQHDYENFRITVGQQLGPDEAIADCPACGNVQVVVGTGAKPLTLGWRCPCSPDTVREVLLAEHFRRLGVAS